MEAFDDVLFPLALGREAKVAPEYRTTIVAGAGGHETRNAGWAEARTRYDAGPGVRSEADIATLLAFFRARMGRRADFASAIPSTPLPRTWRSAPATGRNAASRW